MPKSRKRKNANAFEHLLGVHGTTSSFAQDAFTNMAARTGYGTPSLGQGGEYTLVRLSYDYWQLITLFRNHWISRRIVEVPAQDCVKAWPKMTSDVEPKDLTRIDRALRKTNTKNNVLTGLTWGRLFGGAGGLIVIDGQENELDQPLDLDSIKIGAYKGIIAFDRWAGISPSGDVCTDINRPLDFNKPEMYDCRVAGGASFQVHSSRLLRFLGPTVPTPEVEAQSYWGISVLEPTYESITRLDNMYFNLLNLSFRANLIGMKFPELAQLLSGLGSSQMATQKFEQRMSSLNHLMSNQSLIPLPADGSIEQTQYSFSGMSDVLQLFQLDLSGAAQIPITRLFGRTYNGLGQAGDGDERIYEEKISTDQATYLVPQLEKLYPVVCMSELGEVPDDLDLVCPSIRVLSEQEKSDLAKSVADTTTVYLNGGIMSPRRVAMEVKRNSDVTGIGATLDDEYVAKLSDDVQSEGELGDGLFGGEGAGLNEASSPAKAIKGENEKEKQDEPNAKENLTKKAGKAADSAPAYDALPSGLKAGEHVLVNGKLLTVDRVLPEGLDLFDQPYVPVLFRSGEVVAYRPDAQVQPSTAKVPKWRARDEAEFKEADHPRAENGQFGSGGTRAHASSDKGLRTTTQRAEFIQKDLGVSSAEAYRYAESVTRYSSATGYRAVRDGSDKKTANALDDYIADAPKWDGNGSVYRGLSLSSGEVASLTEGAVLDMNGLSSWSSDGAVADNYAERSVGVFDRGKKRRIIMQMDKADSGASIKHLSDFATEDEVLLPSTTKYEVLGTTQKRKKRGDGTTYTATVVRVREVV